MSSTNFEPDASVLHPNSPFSENVARGFVYLAWAGMTLATLWLVAARGFYLPLHDEYPFLLPVLVGEQPLTLGWLWEQYGPNRLPLGKLVNVILFEVSGGSFQIGAFFNLAGLSLTSLALIVAARRARGRTAFADALFPLVLLSWSHYENIVWNMTVSHVLGYAVHFSVLILIVQGPDRLPARSAVLAAFCIALLALCGPSNLAYIPALSLWLGFLAYQIWSRVGAKATAGAVVGFGILGLVLLGLVFQGFSKDTPSAESSDLGTTLRGALEALSMCLASHTVASSSPVEALTRWLSVDNATRAELPQGDVQLWMVIAGVLVPLILATVALLAWVVLRRPGERLRALGLLLFLGSACCVFLVLGRSRAGAGTLLVQPRYSIFAMPALFTVHLAWSLYGPGPAQLLVPAGLLLGAGVLAPANFAFGLRETTIVRKEIMEGFEADLLAGMPSYALADRHYEEIFPADPTGMMDEHFKDGLALAFRRLRERGVHPFDKMVPDPDAKAITLRNLSLDGARGVVWTNGTARGKDSFSCLIYQMPRPRFVHAIRLWYDLQTEDEQPGFCRVYWKTEGKNEYREDERNVEFSLRRSDPANGVTNKRAYIWVNDRLDQFRIHPHYGPFVLTIHRIEFLVPKE